MTIYEKIKNRRKELGLTAEDVAKALHVSRATVYRYESSEIEKLPTSILEPLCKVLDTTPAYLMGWEETNTSEAYQQGIEDARLIKKYSQLSDSNKMAVLTLIDNLLDAQK